MTSQAAPALPPVAAPIDRREGDSADFPVSPQELPLRPEDKVPSGQGMLEVIAGPSDTVFVDGDRVCASAEGGNEIC